MERTTEKLKWHVAWFRPKPTHGMSNYHICNYNGQSIAHSLVYETAKALVDSHNSILDSMVEGNRTQENERNTTK